MPSSAWLLSCAFKYRLLCTTYYCKPRIIITMVTPSTIFLLLSDAEVGLRFYLLAYVSGRIFRSSSCYCTKLIGNYSTRISSTLSSTTSFDPFLISPHLISMLHLSLYVQLRLRSIWTLTAWLVPKFPPHLGQR